jgi:two-component system OmpR family response regulator
VVDVHVSKLRQKIDTGGKQLLRTVRNAGYRLTADE